ncbi:MAG TPA: thiolase family protein [Anaerolineae bacterium]|nr:thiolase family protein [Anaerolineae bacterium]
MSQAIIVEAVRTPIGKRNGLLKDTHPTELAAAVLNEVVRRAGIDRNQVEDIIMGCASAVGEQALNIGRNAALLAGFPPEVPAVTIDRQCGSSQQAVHFAASLIESGAAELVIAAGVESMTRVPMGSSRANGPGNPFTESLNERYPMVQMGLSAEMIAEKWRLSREALDDFSFRSHRRAAQAASEGFFRREILPLEVTVDGVTRPMHSDEGVRADTSLEKLATLKTPFKEDGVITAGNASQISDGAAALLLTSETKAVELGLKPRARIVAQAAVGDDPVLALTAPIPATRKILAKAGLKLADMDLIEINEAFASVVLAWASEIQPDMERVNVNGGAIALGHPLGASGARIMTTLLHELERREARYGLQTMCCFGGLGVATIIERVAG